MKKEPKRWKCNDCGFISKRAKSVKIPFVGILLSACVKCGGRIRETQEWLDWLREFREQNKDQMIAWGKKIKDKREGDQR